MPRAVPKWLHNVCVRDFGPADPMAKLLLYTIASYTGDDGTCWPSQDELAERMAVGISTVRRKLILANKAHFVAIYPRGKNGQRWKSYYYRLAIPDNIELSAINFKDSTAESLVDHFESVNGCIEDFAVKGSHYPQEGKPRKPKGRFTVNGSSAPETGEKSGSTVHSVQEHRSPSHEAPFTESQRTVQSGVGSSSIEVLHRSSSEEGAALRAGTSTSKTVKTFGTRKTPITTTSIETCRLAGFTTTWEIAKALHTTVEEIETVLRQTA